MRNPIDSAGWIEPEPDPGHAPRKGDQYISRSYGVTITVQAVGTKDGKRWVVWTPASGVRYKSEYDHFRATHRRVLRRKPGRARR